MSWFFSGRGLVVVALVLLLSRVPGARAEEPRRNTGAAWQEELARELPLLGHRNWIVVADAAYPAQSRQGIKTVYVGGDHLQAIAAVLSAIDATKHVQATPLVDAELKVLAESDAPGVEKFRQGLEPLLKGRSVERLPHEEIIRELDDAAKLFRVLIIKTDMTVPYTSVFLRLDCGYWNAEKEQRLRQALEKGK